MIIPLCVFLEMSGIYLIKKYSQTQLLSYLGATIGIYIIYILALSRVFKFRKMATTQALTSGLTMIGTAVLGILLLKEKLKKKEIFGIFLVLLGTFFL